MLLGLIIFGLLLYGLMYFAFSSYTSTNNSGSVAIVAYERVRDMVFQIPASWPMAIFKFILIALILYAIIDQIAGNIRRSKSRRARLERQSRNL